MNDNPATEYALYDPTIDEYVVNDDMSVASWPTAAMARAAGTNFPHCEIHERRNYSITPWVKSEPEDGK